MEKRNGKISNRQILAAVVFLFVGVSACQSDTNTVYHPDITDWGAVDNLVTLDYWSIESADQEIIDAFPSLKIEPDNKLTEFYAPQFIRALKSIIDEEGRVYIRNDVNNSVEVYSESGSLLYSIGGEGQGPGELTAIQDFTLSPDLKTLYILDSYKTEVYKRNAGQFEPYTSFFHGLQLGTGICAGNDQVFMSGQGLMPDAMRSLLNRESSVDDYDEFQGPVTVYGRSDYSFLETFGRQSNTYFNQPFMSSILSESHLVCFPEYEVVVTFRKYFGQADAYTFDGEKLWTLNLENYGAQRFRESLQGEDYSFVHVDGSKERTFLYSINEVAEKPFAVLAFKSYLNEESEYFQITNSRQVDKSVLLDIRDGSMMELSKDQDLITSLSSTSAVIQRFTEDGNIEVYLNR
ncbi:MAG: 6-bladed beta-propeller [Balneolia bacterium]|nr:6-bladed beta-propeller [Balneolia bacterium]